MEKSTIVGQATSLKEKTNALLDDFLLQLASSLELLEQQKTPSTIKEHKLVLELAKLDPELLERLNAEAASKNLPVLAHLLEIVPILSADGGLPEKIPVFPSDQQFVINYSGHEVVYKVPAGVSKMTVKMWGAGGGFGGDSGLDYLGSQNNNNGGAGGFTTMTISVKEGDVFRFRVGGGGKSRADGSYGGFNGGGTGGIGDHSGGGGGGASDVRTRDGVRIAVAGGGGGGGGGWGLCYGGAGGGDKGEDGFNGTYGGVPGCGACLGRGGLSSSQCRPATAEHAGDGATLHRMGGGGGGGGYGGGGGGLWALGGGGGGGYVCDWADAAVSYSKAGKAHVPAEVDHADRHGAGEGGVSGKENGANGRIVVSFQ